MTLPRPTALAPAAGAVTSSLGGSRSGFPPGGGDSTAHPAQATSATSYAATIRAPARARTDSRRSARGLRRPFPAGRPAAPSARAAGSPPPGRPRAAAPSSTSSVISSPRWAGRQCITMAPVGQLHQLARSPGKARSRAALRRLFLLAHAGPHVGVHHVRALHRFAGSRKTRISESPAARARARISSLDRIPRRRPAAVPWGRGSPAFSQEWHTLLPSPRKATRVLSMPPRTSWMVSRSASTWQGW